MQSVFLGIVLDGAQVRVAGLQRADHVDDLDLLPEFQVDDLVAEHAVEQTLHAVGVLADGDHHPVADQEVLERGLELADGVVSLSFRVVGHVIGLVTDDEADEHRRGVVGLPRHDADRFGERVDGLVDGAHGREDDRDRKRSSRVRRQDVLSHLFLLRVDESDALA